MVRMYSGKEDKFTHRQMDGLTISLVGEQFHHVFADFTDLEKHIQGTDHMGIVVMMNFTFFNLRW